jgi:23S rRNA pseudouridine1911/1915/1917 synthase
VRLDLALIRKYPQLSRRKAREVIEKGQVTLDGRMAREAGLGVRPEAKLHWDPNQRSLSRARLSLPLLHQDETLLIVDKPAGLLTVPTSPEAADEDTALSRIQEYVRRLTPRRPYVGVVHRIDRDTSGAVAFALTPRARSALRTLFREHRIERRYSALVVGTPRGEEGIVDLPIRDAYEGGRRSVARAGEPSLPAVTRWKVAEGFQGAALLDVELQTGRQHQIRIHLAHMGLPILGDGVYGRDHTPRSPIPAPRQMLHARTLAFVHPTTGSRIQVESPLPEDFRRVLSDLRRRPHDTATTTPRIDTKHERPKLAASAAGRRTRRKVDGRGSLPRSAAHAASRIAPGRGRHRRRP